jgi:FlaA1/EpsC-like NDP-sugar epimerase
MKLYFKRLPVILHDLLMVVLAWGLAMVIRYDWPLPDDVQMLFIPILWVVVAIQGAVLWYSGLYKGIWRFCSMPDFSHILRAAVLGTLLIILVLMLFNRLEGIPRSSLILYPVLLIFLLGMPRLLYRLYHENSWLLTAPNHQRVLVLGAGTSGDMLVRDMLRNPNCGYIPVGFLDDQPRLHGGNVQGVPVLGAIDSLPEIVDSFSIDLIVIAMPSASDQQMQRVVEDCERGHIPFRTLPKFDHLVSQQVNLSDLRDVSIDDLLGRARVQLDWEGIAQGLSGKTVMVSGGGGSIGTELCRQIARLKPSALVIFERCEYNLYQAELLLRATFPALPLYIHLGDVGDRKAVRHILGRYRPQIIFHAAAYKHVPMLQTQIREAVRNNVIGTRILAESAAQLGCEKFVLISTDKAVNPSNIMGATKRAAEIFCQGMNAHTKTHFLTVRFGNVLGSAGSVVPLFKKQIAAGGPVTVTHPEISRYFMTIPEACQLILQAGAMGHGGEIFVLDMGTPIPIRYLAEQMIRLTGKIPNKDIAIIYTGLRPGEKLHEELFHLDETLQPTSHQKILLAAHNQEEDWDGLLTHLDQLQCACDRYDEMGIEQLLKLLVPKLGEQN